VIKFVSGLGQISTPVASTNKTDRHDIAEILLKVALNTITLTRTTRLNRILKRFILILNIHDFNIKYS